MIFIFIYFRLLKLKITFWTLAQIESNQWSAETHFWTTKLIRNGKRLQDTTLKATKKWDRVWKPEDRNFYHQLWHKQARTRPVPSLQQLHTTILNTISMEKSKLHDNNFLFLKLAVICQIVQCNVMSESIFLLHVSLDQLTVKILLWIKPALLHNIQ